MKGIAVSPWMVAVTMVVLSVVVLAGRGVRSELVGETHQLPAILIQQPPTWQPFTAELTQTTVGAPDLVGHYYRASDGSDRYDQATRDGSVHFVTIFNVQSGLQYACDMITNRCQRRPAGDGAGRLMNIRVGTRGLAPRGERIEGYELYEYTDASGGRSLLAPALNFASLVTIHPGRGYVRTMSRITLGEPSNSLFEPPAAAEMIDPRPLGAPLRK